MLEMLGTKQLAKALARCQKDGFSFVRINFFIDGKREYRLDALPHKGPLLDHLTRVITDNPNEEIKVVVMEEPEAGNKVADFLFTRTFGIWETDNNAIRAIRGREPSA